MKKPTIKEKILKALEDKPKKKVMEFKVTQKMINETNKLHKQLGLEPIKDKPHKLKYLFG